MCIIDLSHIIDNHTPVYPGTELADIRATNILESDGFIEHRISFHTHTGTHIDAPAHILPQSKKLSDYSIKDFIGNGCVIDCRDVSIISPNFIEQNIPPGPIPEFILLFTNWDKYWGKDAYFKNFPVLHPECGIFLYQKGIKGIGIDAISIDAVENETLPAHHSLMGKEILIVENLTGLEQLLGKSFEFYCIPIKLNCPDGSPVRAFAKY